MFELRCDSWQAVYDPASKPGALRVIGVCHAPQPGWAVTLHRTGEDGGSRELHLRLDVARPQVAPDERTDVEVEFVAFMDEPVEKVSIDGVERDIPVEVLPEEAPG